MDEWTLLQIALSRVFYFWLLSMHMHGSYCKHNLLGFTSISRYHLPYIYEEGLYCIVIPN